MAEKPITVTFDQLTELLGPMVQQAVQVSSSKEAAVQYTV